MSIRTMDAFAKPRDGLESRSALGGIITLIAAGSASMLFLGNVLNYVRGTTRHSLHLSRSSPMVLLPKSYQGKSKRRLGHVPLAIHLTFPHIACEDLDFAHDNAFYSTGDFQSIHGDDAIRFRRPTLRELRIATGKSSSNARDSCTLQGKIDIPMVGGTFTATVSLRAWREATGMIAAGNQVQGGKRPPMVLFNASHHVHSITFGEHFPLSKNPLEDSAHIIENESGGVGLANVNVRLIPTTYKRLVGESDTYQVSVTEHLVQPEYLAAQHSRILPGLALTYDFTPLTVQHIEHRDNFFVFLSSLVSIVGGVFVTVALVTGLLFHSAAAVAKKKD